jgi:hypothetical protein
VRRGLTLLLLAAAGCDRVFGLADLTGYHDGTSDARPQCDYEGLDPARDDDGDGVLNGVDACPTVPSASPADEDGDQVPDACDLCPQFVMAGADGDCDGIGAACDPDDTLPHDRTFYGFADATGISLYQASVVDGAINFSYATNTFHSVRTLANHLPEGMFEATFVIRNNDTDFGEWSIVLLDGPNTSVLRFEIEFDADKWSLVVVDGMTDMAQVDIGSRPADVQFRLRGFIEGGTVRAELTGDGAATTMVTLPAVTKPVTMGLWSYRDSVSPTMTIDVPYLLHIQPR